MTQHPPEGQGISPEQAEHIASMYDRMKGTQNPDLALVIGLRSIITGLQTENRALRSQADKLASALEKASEKMRGEMSVHCQENHIGKEGWQAIDECTITRCVDLERIALFCDKALSGYRGKGGKL